MASARRRRPPPTRRRRTSEKREWQLVREHVLLRGVAWFWLELPARASCVERERKRACVAFDVDFVA